MQNTAIHGLVTRDSVHERRENPAKQASSMLRGSGVYPPLIRPPSPEPSSQGFLLLGPHTCGTSVVCADQTLTRASQRGHGGLRIEPGGGSKGLQPYGRSICFKSVQRDSDGMAPGSITKARAVLLRYGSALLKHSPKSSLKEPNMNQKLEILFRKMQADAATYLEPGNNLGQDWFVSRMLWHLDGPEQREAQRTPLFTTCCHVQIPSDRRYCPKCGWEASIKNPGEPICE